MKIHTPGEGNKTARVAVYGEPKKGKTRLVTSLPWGPIWGERAVYVAWDPGAAALEPVALDDRERLLVVTPQPRSVKRIVPGVKEPVMELVYDPLTEAIEIAKHDWAKEGCGTLIWDTLTTTAEDLLSAISAGNAMKVSKGYDQPMSVGTPGTDTYVPQPALADFGAAQRTVLHILDFLFLQPINVIVAFHSADDDSDGKADQVGGPATIGRAAIRSIAKRFDNLFRVTLDRQRVPNTMPPQHTINRVVQTDSQSYWLTGLRSFHGKNPIPTFSIEDDGCRKFWPEFDKVRGAIK